VFSLTWQPAGNDHQIHLSVEEKDGFVCLHTDEGMIVSLDDDEVDKLIAYLRQMKREKAG
jgi:hypothetical protein